MTESKLVALNLIRIDRRAYPRAEIDDERVAILRDLYAASGPTALPAIEVVATADGTLVVADGAHRLTAAHSLRWTEISVDLVVVPAGVDPLDTAYLRALDSATSAAKPLTRAERLQAMRRLIAEHPEWSDREIARRAGTSHTTVAKARTIEQQPAEEVDGSELYLTARAAEQAAAALVRAVARAWNDRGLTDLLLNRMPGTLAAALEAQFGNEARIWAERIERWASGAQADLDRRGKA
jgi:ParB-like chromosome segregation protein Spo0J